VDEGDSALQVEAVGGAVRHDGHADVAGDHGELADDGLGEVDRRFLWSRSTATKDVCI
jgi:hypothetical protein